MKNINKKWLAWFTGFVDAEGNFQVFPIARKNVKGVVTHYGVGYHFHLGMSLRDLKLLEDIMQVLGNKGKIYIYPDKDEAHYAISRREEVIEFILMVMSHYPLLTLHQASPARGTRADNKMLFGLTEGVKRFDTLEEFHEYFDSKALLESPSIKTNEAFGPLNEEFIDSPSKLGAWIVGFINGEGSFTKGSGATGAAFKLGHTDKEVLDMMRERLQTNPKISIAKKRINRKQIYTYEINTRSDLNKLILLLNDNIALQGYKYFQYQEWLKNNFK